MHSLPENFRLKCVECGKDVEELHEGECTECFIKNHNFLEAPIILNLSFCKSCNAVKINKNWRSFKSKELGFECALLRVIKISDLVERSKMDFQFNRGFKIVRVILEGEVFGDPIRVERDIELRIKPSTCLRCAKKFGGYYESIIQIRNPRLLEPTISFLRSHETEDDSVVKTVDLDEGLDIYLSSIHFGFSLSKFMRDKYLSKIKTSRKLVGMKRGKKLSRVTFCLR